MSTNKSVYENLLKLIFIITKARNKPNILCQALYITKKKNKHYTMSIEENELQIDSTINFKSGLVEASYKKVCIYESTTILIWISGTKGKLIICDWNQKSSFLWGVTTINWGEAWETGNTETWYLQCVIASAYTCMYFSNLAKVDT